MHARTCIFRYKSDIIRALGMQLHRQDLLFKKCKPTTTKCRKTSQNINARGNSTSQFAYAYA